ncbi:tetratricopeptide (TPR) repeat protein [Variovorax sp. W1I1]|uniref:tetratricopeptide repeat protein n=1 Tax=Variovorax sp. W1I1 TaxID=3042309 RepID=UPI00277E4E7E|nr:tetratricopeptide repeat protein [Variovorax sp. W1I1]MDQ0608024.1 tetratricopeptide (TPR) repeat protein [Variovorax sp. W1I1]
MTAPEEFPLSLRNVLKSFGLSRHTVLKLIELGFVAPVKADDNVWKFSFQDLVLLRSANELRAARIPTRQILKALRQLRASLPEDQPLRGMRITSEGDRVTVRFGDAHWEPQTGQFVLDLQIRSGESPLSFFPSRSAPLVGAVALDARFAEAEALEETAPRIAEALYRSILADDPTYAHAYLNLGFMLCESGEFDAAASLYEKGLRFCPDDPLMHFNLAVALEGVSDVDGALASYEEALRLQPDLLDAHRNAALLYADSGRQQMAIRHFSAFRRLQAGKQPN